MGVTASQINTILLDRFGIEVDFTSSIDDLRSLMELYTDRRQSLIEGLGSDAAVKSPDYVKSHLISEAVRIFLREIAPRRLKKHKGKSA